MHFIYPEFLYALGFLALPIIIHLFNFKRFKTIYFPDVSFLKEIKQRSQSTSRIKHLFVLISRMLLLSCLVIAFAQPFLKEDGEVSKMGKQGVQIYLDNSFSMESQAKQGRLFDEAKQRVYTIINSYSPSDRFQIICNSFDANIDLWLNSEEAIERIQNIEINNRSKKLSDILGRFSEADQEEVDQIDIYLISDFQRNNFDLDKIDSLNSNTELHLVLLDVVENDNISLQDVEFEKPFHLPEQTEKLQAKLVRHGSSEKLKIPVKLYLDDELKVPLSLDFNTDDTLMAEMNFQSGQNDIQIGTMVIKDYPITFDDTLYFNYSLKSKIQILHIYNKEANKYISALFSEDSLYNYSKVDPNKINYTELDQSSLIILDELTSLSSGTASALQKFIDNGGDVIFIPLNNNIDPSINDFLKKLGSTQFLDLQQKEIRINEINRNSEVYSGVFESFPKNIDLPSLKEYWLISENSRSIREDLLTLQDGSPFLRLYTLNKGKLYILTSSLSQEGNNFGRHALFVPTLYNIALYSQEKKRLYYSLEEPLIQLEDISAKESPVHIVSKGLDLIPQQAYKDGNLNIRLNNSIDKAGHYKLLREGELLGILSLNYGREESDYRLMSSEEISDYADQYGLEYNTYDNQTETLSQEIKNSKEGQPLWKYFIILALFFMAAEIAFLRLLK